MGLVFQKQDSRDSSPKPLAICWFHSAQIGQSISKHLGNAQQHSKMLKNTPQLLNLAFQHLHYFGKLAF